MGGWWLVFEIAVIAVGIWWIRSDLRAGRRRTWLLALTVAFTVAAGIALTLDLWRLVAQS